VEHTKCWKKKRVSIFRSTDAIAVIIEIRLISK